MSVNRPESPEAEADTREEVALAALYVEMARERHVMASDNKIEIEAEPKVSFADEGAWVAAWVWVDRPDSWDGD